MKQLAALDLATIQTIGFGDVKPKFTIETYCFPEQVAFIRDESSFKTAVCSRRSGKTVSCAADLIETATKFSNCVCLYITLNRISGKRIIWNDLTFINRKYELGAKVNETELSLKFPNGSVIYVSGAKDKSEIEKFRGLAIKKAYIDECASFRNYIQDLIDDVIAPALFDYAGQLILIGTPGPVPVGYFYECSQSEEWSHHSWTMFQNPWLTKKSGMTVEELVQRELKRKGVTKDNPVIQREIYGQWVVDEDSLVFKYNTARNDFDKLPELTGEWFYIVGFDIGFNDADAIAVIAWNDHEKKAYLVEEYEKSQQGITELADELARVYKQYKPLKMVGDFGALGKKIGVELQKRFTLPVTAADKTRKLEAIEILNDALRTGQFKAKKNGLFAQDCFKVEWDRDTLRTDQKKVSDKYHSDICDGILYGFKECLHFISEAPPKKIEYGTSEYLRKQEEDMEQAAEFAYARAQEDDLWGDLR